MVALYDHIQQLRAELSVNSCATERALIAAELAAAETAHAIARDAFEADFKPPD